MPEPMAPTPAVSAKEKARAWRYSINYGPEGEANYAMVYDADDVLVSNLKTYHAISVVNAMNAALSATEDEAEPVALPLPADKELPPVTDRGFAGQIMDVAWPHYGGNHQTAEFWNDFGEGVRFALHYASPPSAPSAPAGVKVKALEWRKEDDEDWWEAPALGYPAAYATWVSALGAVRLRLFREAAFSLFYGTLDEAKAAAQADYESRIRSSLQPDTLAAAASAPAQAEALPAGVDAAAVLSTLNRMVTDYLAPDTYKARFPRENIPWHSDFPTPDKHHSEAGADQVNRRRDQAFIRDVIHLQDNPLGIKPREPASLSSAPAQEGRS